MSLRFQTCQVDRTAHPVSMVFEPILLVALFGMGVALLVAFLQVFRTAVRTSPDVTALACASSLAIGLTLLFLAKAPTLGSGSPMSFRPSKMSNSCYYAGYVFLAVGTIAILLFLSLPT